MINDRAAARKLLETAMAEWRPGRGENEYELASIPESLAQLVDRPAESLDLLARAHRELARMLGTDHPKVIEVELVEVAFTGDLARARALQDAACTRLGRLFPQLDNERKACEYDAGWMADEAGDARAAATHFAAATFDLALDPKPQLPSVKGAPYYGMDYKQKPASLEARWDENGAICLGTPRLTVNPAAQFPDVQRAIRDACEPAPDAAVRILRPCKDPDPNHMGGEHVVDRITSANWIP